jgi:hypothetical protein
MNLGMAIGKSNPATSAMVAGGQLGEDSGPVSIGWIGIENGVVNAVGVFVDKEPGVARAGQRQVSGLFGPEISVLQVLGHGFRPGLDVELFIDTPQVGADGGHADAHLVGDLLVGQPL